MPFKSEKQRRYLWLKHPDIAKRWAKEYPNQKDLPMRVSDKDSEKESAAAILSRVLPNKLNNVKIVNNTEKTPITRKEADSKQEYVELPKTHGPTFAGETGTQADVKQEQTQSESPQPGTCKNTDELTADALFKKLSVVLSPRLMQEVEDEQARQQAREAQRMPQNAGIKPMPPAVNNIPPPMGMAQPAPNPGQTQPAQPAQPQQPANGQLASVGGGASPNANPINAFGGLSSTGDINGNAALGTQNMAGGEKMAAGNETLAYLMSMGNMDIPDPDDLDYDERMTEKFSALGLWDRIRAKKERGGKPAKPGDKDYPDAKSWKKVTGISEKQSGSPEWQRAAGKNEEGGLNAKGRASYNKATGGNLKAPVTEKNPTGKAKKRRKSFCSRMCGMKQHETGAKTKADPDSRINKALRKWNCKCSACEKTADLAGKMLTNINDKHDTVKLIASLIGLTAPTVIGGGVGALTSRKGKRLAGALRGAGIGAAYTAGGHLGHTIGQAVAPGSFGGGVGGAIGGAAAAHRLLPKIEDEEEVVSTPREFGAKVAYDWQGRRQYTHVEDVRDPAQQSARLGDPKAMMSMQIQNMLDPELHGTVLNKLRGESLSQPGATHQARAVENYVAGAHVPPVPAAAQQSTFHAGHAVNDMLRGFGVGTPKPTPHPIQHEVSGMMKKFGPTPPPAKLEPPLRTKGSATRETLPSGLPKFKYPAVQKLLDQILPKLKAPPTGAVKYTSPVAQ